ncbi:hypothetical protein DL98DRAFT_567622 [Cadophora sp. DSE1049]|nr:hypothetical protein DL98DRAFT_567622 [Cadophora sp. DSE1049]
MCAKSPPVLRDLAWQSTPPRTCIFPVPSTLNSQYYSPPQSKSEFLSLPLSSNRLRHYQNSRYISSPGGRSPLHLSSILRNTSEPQLSTPNFQVHSMASRNPPTRASKLNPVRSVPVPANKPKPATQTTEDPYPDSDSEDGGAELAPWTADETVYCGYKTHPPSPTSTNSNMSPSESGKEEKMLKSENSQAGYEVPNHVQNNTDLSSLGRCDEPVRDAVAGTQHEYGSQI